MPSPHVLLTFALAAYVFAVLPGPAVTYIVTRSVDQGRKAGIASSAAAASGNLVYVLAAAVGLSALLASSATAFTAVRLLGAAYLVWLGVRRLMRRERAGGPAGPRTKSTAQVYREGVLVQLLNPKTALFFASVLPQFVDPTGGPAAAQILVLGGLLTVITFISDCVYAILSGTASGYLRRPSSSRALGIVSGGAYVGLGLYAAVSGSRSQS